MRKQVIFGLIALFVTACSSSGEVTHEYDEYLAQFNKDIMKLGYNPIDFSGLVIKKDEDSATGENGRCMSVGLRDSGPVEIRIGKRAFGFDEKKRMLLVYHELGHCYLGLGHADGSRKIMNSDSQQPFTYVELGDDSFRLSLVKEMVESSDYKLLQFHKF